MATLERCCCYPSRRNQNPSSSCVVKEKVKEIHILSLPLFSCAFVLPAFCSTYLCSIPASSLTHIFYGYFSSPPPYYYYRIGCFLKTQLSQMMLFIKAIILVVMAIMYLRSPPTPCAILVCVFQRIKLNVTNHSAEWYHTSDSFAVIPAHRSFIHSPLQQQGGSQKNVHSHKGHEIKSIIYCSLTYIKIL